MTSLVLKRPGAFCFIFQEVAADRELLNLGHSGSRLPIYSPLSSPYCLGMREKDTGATVTLPVLS